MEEEDVEEDAEEDGDDTKKLKLGCQRFRNGFS